MSEALRHSAPHDVVFIHGAGETGILWRRTLEGLSGDRSAIALNLPGHPTGEATCKTVRDYAEAVHRLMLSVGLRRPAVCGHSMGGAIALTLALEHPEDVGALILVGTGAKLGVLPEITEGLRDEPVRLIERTITPMSFYEVSLAVGREARASLALSNPGIFLNDYLACSGFDARDRLPQIGHRALIICGENDRMTPPKWSHYLNANITRSTIFFVRESGHMVPLEKPEICGRLIQDFLAGLSQ
jgi:pimeloyl-ACP methyl ester carboxylesterase